MASSRDALVHLAYQQAGLSDSQIEAVRRGDVGALVNEGWPATARPPARELDAARQSLRATRRRLSAVREQLDASLVVLGQLAAILGCCVRCWGTNERCPTCHGRGSPGFHEPDAQLLSWVTPALERSRSREQPAHPGADAFEPPPDNVEGEAHARAR